MVGLELFAITECDCNITYFGSFKKKSFTSINQPLAVGYSPNRVQAALVIRGLFIRGFAVQENIPKFTIRGLSLAHSRFIEEIRL